MISETEALATIRISNFNVVNEAINFVYFLLQTKLTLNKVTKSVLKITTI